MARDGTDVMLSHGLGQGKGGENSDQKGEEPKYGSTTLTVVGRSAALLLH